MIVFCEAFVSRRKLNSRSMFTNVTIRTRSIRESFDAIYLSFDDTKSPISTLFQQFLFKQIKYNKSPLYNKKTNIETHNTSLKEKPTSCLSLFDYVLCNFFSISIIFCVLWINYDEQNKSVHYFREQKLHSSYAVRDESEKDRDRFIFHLH